MLEEEERIRQEKEKDYLAPFLARLGDKNELTKDEKTRVREECLQDMRTRLVEVANIIQSHFEKVLCTCTCTCTCTCVGPVLHVFVYIYYIIFIHIYQLLITTIIGE